MTRQDAASPGTCTTSSATRPRQHPRPQDEPPRPLLITDHDQLREAISLHEIRATLPVVNATCNCLDHVLVPISPDTAHDMLREAVDHQPYDLCLRAEAANDDEEIHLEVVEKP